MNNSIGSSLDDFLAEEGLLAESEMTAIKRVIAMELSKGIKQHLFNKTQLAHRIGTSRSAVNRLLDPSNTSVTLHTLDKAARAIGKKIQLSLI